MPVQNYSSGMKVRLGFSVAVQMEPDVLIIDEVLAVGDLGFFFKCLSKIGELIPKTAIIFVSHNMPQVARICNKVLYITKGEKLFYSSSVNQGIKQYVHSFKNADFQELGSGEVTLNRILMNPQGVKNEEELSFINGENLNLYFKLSINKRTYWIFFYCS